MFGGAVTWAPPARAEIANPTEDILLVLEGAPGNLDPERVRAAIARELGVRITLAAQPASGASTLTLHGDVRSHIRLSYRSGDGRVTEREIDLPSEPDRAEEVVALLAGNLVRDEAAELGAALKKKAEKPPAPAPITTPPLVAAKAPTTAAPGAPARPQCAREGSPPDVVGLDFLPYAGTSTFRGVGTSRRFSLNILGGYAAGVNGVELGGLLNIDEDFACGIQMAGLANLALGPVRGVQAAGFLNLGRRLDGAQLGLVNIVTDVVHGAQLGLGNAAGGAVSGTQIGLVNLAGGHVRGAQLGLVNVANSSTFSLGLINIFRDGRLEIDAWGQESGLLMAGIKHGSGHFHSIYGVGVLPFGAHARFAAALGLGARLPLTNRLFLEIDVLDHALLGAGAWAATWNLAQARVLLGARLARKLAVFGGPSFNVVTSWDGEVPELSPYGVSFTRAGGNTVVQGWPGVTLGLQVL